MADFAKFLPTLLKHEGGYVNDPADPGGATNKGVTLKTFEAHAQKLLGIAPTLDNLKKLTDDQAGKIYKAEYWDKIKGDDIKTQHLAEIVFDFYVNAGANASKLLQKVMNELGAGIAVDGGIGAGTIAALNKMDDIEVYRRFKEGRKQYYKDLCEKKPTLSKFLKGWLIRVDSFPDL